MTAFLNAAATGKRSVDDTGVARAKCQLTHALRLICPDPVAGGQTFLLGLVGTCR